MKYTRSQFKDDLYQLWEKGTLPSASQNAQSYSVKYRIGEQKDYASIGVKAENFHEALERACFLVALESALLPENVDLHSVYDIQGNLLWGDELSYEIAKGKYDASGMSRRAFLTAFGLTSAALLIGVRPRTVHAATTTVNLSGTANGFTYVDDVFGTYLYTGNGSSQTINNGIDLAGYGGMVWVKNRSNAQNNVVWTRAVGGQLSFGDQYLSPNLSSVVTSSAFNMLSTGFQITAGFAYSNASSDQYVSWAFRKATKFFDCGTFTADGTANQRVAHSLGVAPGLILIKATNTVENWCVYHSSQGRGKYGVLNTTAAFASVANIWGTSDPTATDFGVSSGITTTPYASYVWYAFAHDTSVDGIIQCGSYTGNSAGISVNLGWEPQFVLIKNVTVANDWILADTFRGMTVNSAGFATLYANTSVAEVAAGSVSGAQPTSTGFNVSYSSSATNYPSTSAYVYMAIRRPNKPPTTGTQVYNAIARTGTGVAATVTGVGFAPDLILGVERTKTYAGQTSWLDRLRGRSVELESHINSAESAYAADGLLSFDMDGYSAGADASFGSFNKSGKSLLTWNFKRAPGFMDVVCYSGTGVARDVRHSLGVAPELMIVKARTNNSVNSKDWLVYIKSIWDAGGYVLRLNANAIPDYGRSVFNNTAPTSSVFSLGTPNESNSATDNYVCYLFATAPGISKVGNYVGNGSTQTINCGFSTGARFALVKRTDNIGDWYIWDSVRGIVAANDPHLSLNTTAAEVTTDDSIDPDVSGFIVNQNTATNINVNGASYIFLAIA